jgi:hypothetical protein
MTRLAFRRLSTALAVTLLAAGCNGADPATDAANSITVTVTPPDAQVLPRGAVTFAAVVTGTVSTSVTWKVVESSGGSVNTSGRYVAPSGTGTFHVQAASVADPSVFGNATVVVTATPSVAVTVSPTSVTLAPGTSRTFAATVTGSTDTAVAWSVTEGATGGTIDPTGVYTAPANPGTYHVVATSHADSSKKATVVVTVSAPGGTCGVDACPAPKGVVWECEKRFMYGTNYAWRTFGGDFGGYSAWGASGVAAGATQVDKELAAMKAAEVSVIRWWMFPHLSGDGLTVSSGTVTGIKGTMVADIQKALELANKNGVYLMLTPFSFDNFSGANGPSMSPMVRDATKRKALLDNLVAKIADAVEASPYKHRLIAWDMVNEPEWAVTGASLTGDPAFEPDGSLDPVTHLQMQTFLQEMAATLRAHSTALVSIGGAAIKWGHAWDNVSTDFAQLHYYDWVYQWFPYTTVTLASEGLTSKPVVMGEFPMDGLSAAGGLPARTASQFAADLWSRGYAGALSWAYNDPGFPFQPAQVKAFADQHVCEVTY